MKRRLNKKGKILMSVLNGILSVIIYVFMGYIGQFATESIIYQMIAIIGWGWLFFGQFAVLGCIWEI